MKIASLCFLCITTGILAAQSQSSSIEPVAGTVLMDGEIRNVYLSPGYATVVRLPEEISSVAIGNPASFKSEHSESESRLVLFKPITAEAAQSNAFITTKSGQEVSLHLLSAGKGARNPRVDFFLDYQPVPSFLVPAISPRSLILDSLPAAPTPKAPNADEVAQQLKTQKQLSSLNWIGKEILIARGHSIRREQDTILGFSVLNASNEPVELLGPQMELSSSRKRDKSRPIKAEPVPISEYRLTLRRLAPGQRGDGVVVFERPAFKESSEELFLRIAQAAEVDRPVLLPLPFTTEGDTQ